MKSIVTSLLISCVVVLGFSSCKEKKKSDDIIVAKYVPEKPTAPVRLSADQRKDVVQWLGGQYVVLTSREPADSLPMLTDEMGQKYVDNRVTVIVTRSNNTVFLKKTFVKESFASYVEDGFRHKSILENIVFHGIEDGSLKFGVVVSRPDSDDEFVPLDMLIDRNGGLSIKPGKLFDNSDEMADTDDAAE